MEVVGVLLLSSNQQIPTCAAASEDWFEGYFQNLRIGLLVGVLTPGRGDPPFDAPYSSLADSRYHVDSQFDCGPARSSHVGRFALRSRGSVLPAKRPPLLQDLFQ